jgi:DNA-binding CsgD family transcriptional regulator/PAS domain-containing protein
VDPQALDLVPRVYEAAAHPEAWDPFLEDLARRMRGSVPALFLVEPESGATLLERAPALDPAWQRAYADHYQRVDLRRRALNRRPEGTVIAGHALLPDEVLERSEFYNDFLRPQGFFHIALGLPIRRRERVAAIRVIRTLGEQPFDDADLAPLRTLVSHLRAALDLHCELSEARRLSAGLSGALAVLGVGAILLDAGGRVAFANAEAERLLAAGDGLAIQRRRLRLDSPHEDAALQRLAASRSGGGALKISRPSGRSTLEARVIPLPAAASALGSPGASALVFVREPERACALDPETLRGLYGFTPAELRVAALVAEGRSAPAIARELGVSVETVRTHQKRLREKTGAGGRAELVRMFSGSLASLREPR